MHVTPVGMLATARHYLPDLVYGAYDGIITTFAVVAGVAGGALSRNVVLVIGVANLLADGLSMAAGNYQAIRSREGVLRSQNLPAEETQPALHACATFLAFVVAGAVPLLPYVWLGGTAADFRLAIVVTLGALTVVGVLRAIVTDGRWLRGAVEMCALGGAVAGVAYACGVVVARVAGGSHAG